MNIKIATEKQQIEDAYNIRKVVFVDEQRVPLEEEIDEYEDEAIHYVGYVGDEPVAASRLRFIGHYGKLERICILKEHRGKSYGSLIIQAMEKEVKKRALKEAILNAQVKAISFYEKQGYEVVSGEFLDAGIPHVTMAKLLK
ncbi:MAG TPA: GNAT family N-acetyltransferase [Bacillota bacterium]|nr:GNAT family N-acetyltransferase [Bacillota bacterium]